MSRYNTNARFNVNNSKCHSRARENARENAKANENNARSK